MKRRHIISISLILAFAAVVGGIAATRTAQLGAAASATPITTSSGVAQQSRQLNRAEAALRRALARKPPALPPLPAARVSNATPAAQAQQVVYVRPAPIVHVVPRPGGGEGEGHDGGDGHEGGGGDD